MKINTKKKKKKLLNLQEACVSPDRQVKLGCICNEQDVAVYVNGRSDRLEEQRKDVPRLVLGDDYRRGEVVHLK